MIILIDMDGVIADYNLGVHRKLKQKFSKITANDSFYIKERYGPEHHQEIDKICNKKDFFRKLKPIEGGIEALHKMIKLGHEVFICTSYFSEYPNSINEKVKWILENLGEDWLKRLIITKDKTLIYGDILIDDKPEIKGCANPAWKQVIFDQPYNQHIKGQRLLSWANWESILK